MFIACFQFKEEVCSLEFTSVMEAMLLLKVLYIMPCQKKGGVLKQLGNHIFRLSQLHQGMLKKVS